MLFLFILLNALPVPMLRQVYFQWFFRCLFSGCFREGLFFVFSRFCEVLRVPREVIFGRFLAKIEVFGEKVGPSFLHTLTAFWLDFGRSGTSCGCQKTKKTASKLSSFFDVETKAPKPFFIILNTFLGSFWKPFG